MELVKFASVQELLNRITLNRRDILNIAKKTTEQRDSSEWFQARVGRLTASKFGELL